MAQAVEPERGAGSVSFEVERFEPRGGDQLVLSGRWFGLRGRRFVRPTLTLGSGDSRQRALADLEHKPWAAEDGELWEAAFPIERDGGDPGSIELTVAPDITVALPAPGSAAREQRIRARPRRDDLLDNLRGARRDGRPSTGSGNGRDPRRDGRSATGWEEGLEAQREAPRVPEAPSTASQPGRGGRACRAPVPGPARDRAAARRARAPRRRQGRGGLGAEPPRRRRQSPDGGACRARPGRASLRAGRPRTRPGAARARPHAQAARSHGQGPRPGAARPRTRDRQGEQGRRRCGGSRRPPPGSGPVGHRRHADHEVRHGSCGHSACWRSACS